MDTLHVEHPFEECNADSAAGMTFVDAWTAEAMLTDGQAVACQHCRPEPVG